MQSSDPASPFGEPNPYSAPSGGYPPPKPGEGAGRLRYARAWTYAFGSEQWPVNLLFGTIMTFIPVVGPLILAGYQFTIVEALHRDPQRTYPDFDFSRFAEYLVRGVWVFLVQLILSILMTPLFFWMFMAAMMLMALVAPAGSEEGLVLGLFLLIIPGMLLITIPLAVLFTPMVIRAGLAQDIGMAFDFAWIKGFIAKTWKEIVLGTLFLMATSPLVSLLGALICCVGMYPAMVLILLAQAHFYHQFYELFLVRGGEPIPLKDPQQQGW
ncbi:MAG: DUF4013 domain-containing protein [Planctomycetes bacterium]|nr:DUF4013 domain-containing protein [Planctomycetota bacterium]